MNNGKIEKVEFSEFYPKCENDITKRLIQEQITPVMAYNELDLQHKSIFIKYP